ncbi:MAG: hypothetical protein ABIH46_03395 [Chloroflexota bacterium]
MFPVQVGYMRKAIRFDLTAGKMQEESLPPEEVLRSYVGCRGLGIP